MDIKNGASQVLSSIKTLVEAKRSKGPALTYIYLSGSWQVFIIFWPLQSIIDRMCTVNRVHGANNDEVVTEGHVPLGIPLVRSTFYPFITSHSNINTDKLENSL